MVGGSENNFLQRFGAEGDHVAWVGCPPRSPLLWGFGGLNHGQVVAGEGFPIRGWHRVNFARYGSFSRESRCETVFSPFFLTNRRC